MNHLKSKSLAAFLGAVLALQSLTACGTSNTPATPVQNFTPPALGEEIVTISVRDFGTIKIKLFPELLPEACENFTTLAKNGYYDELLIHRVIQNFMMQGGDPKGNGTGGESCWGGKFDGGVSDALIHVRGAVAYANRDRKSVV